MSVASIITLGYGQGVQFLPTIGYLSSNTPPPTPTRDTHDAWIPDHIVRKFYEDERLKHSKVITTYKKIIKAEEQATELREIVSEYSPDTSKLTKNLLNEIAQDKVALGRLLKTIDLLESKLFAYRQDAEDDDLLLMLAAIA